jgi:DNA adenine methylase
MKTREDVRSWLRSQGRDDVVLDIDAVIRSWVQQGKKTRRNWWDVLAGDKDGNPRRVLGVAFPVLPAARSRQRRELSPPQPSKRAIRAKPETVVGAAASSSNKTKTNKTRTKAVDGGANSRRISASEVPLVPQHRARPFVKWAGGKRQLLPAILELVPGRFGTYHEPFLGGGAVFFALSAAQAFLSDSNERLVRCYRGIKNHVTDVIAFLKEYKKNRRFFLQMRRKQIDNCSDAEIAAWFIFLNKMGFNGLYRVNSKNRFNVPFGDNTRAQICDEDNLNACSRALATAEINCEDFSRVLARAQPGDLVYFDPPYVPLNATSYFTSYTAEGFTAKDQIRLRDLALELKRKGVHVILSNSSTAESLYGGDFSLRRVLAARAVNSRVDRRGKIAELLIS